MMLKKKFAVPFLVLLSVFLVFSYSCKNDAKKYKDLPAELAELNRQIDKRPKDDKLYYKRADYYFNKKEFDNALADILKAIKLNPKESEYNVFLSDIYFVQMKFDDMEETLEKAIAKNPKNNDARMRLAEFYLHFDLFQKCYRVLDEAVSLKPHNPKAHLIRAFALKAEGDTANYLRLLQLTIDQSPTEIQAFLELGWFYQQKLNPIAINYYTNALQVAPRNVIINYNLAKLYQDLEEWDKAEEQYKILLQIKPNYLLASTNYYIQSLHSLGYIKLEHEENYDEAIVYFTKALDIDPFFIRALCNRAFAFIKKGEYKLAEQDLKTCLSTDPHCDVAIELLNDLDKIKAEK